MRVGGGTTQNKRQSGKNPDCKNKKFNPDAMGVVKTVGTS
jgi:hypothetical protein